MPKKTPQEELVDFAGVCYPTTKEFTPPSFCQTTQPWTIRLPVTNAMTPAYCEFHNTGDPFKALAALVECHDHQQYPPVAVMKWIAQGAQRFLESDGREPLEECLGLKAKQKGKHRRKPKAEASLMVKYYFACEELSIWMHLGLSQEQAYCATAIKGEYTADGLKKLHSHRKDNPAWRAAEEKVKYMAEQHGRYSWGLSSDVALRRAWISQYPLAELKAINVDGANIPDEILQLHPDYQIDGP